ncbi:hypothetical protein Tco_0353250 [Tanacetum coccineum]
MTKSSSTSLNPFLEETNTFDNSLTESFCFDLEENSSGSTTTHSDYSLPDYEAFYSDDDHIKEKSSGSTTTHADFSQYDSFIFDLSINPFPPADRSDFYHEEFADELAHIISPPEYDHFCFKTEPELGNLTMDVVEDIFPTREPRVHVPNVLPTHPTLDTDFILLRMSRIFEASRARGICPSITRASQSSASFGNPERISKKRTKNKAKTTKPGTEWKSVEKTKSRQSPSVKKSTKVNPDKSKSQEV